MARVCLRVTNYSDLLSTNLIKLFSDTKSKDFRVICHGQMFLMHKFLLRIFSDDPLVCQKEDVEMRIDDIQPRIVQQFLSILYFGETQVEHSDLKSMRLCAQLMGMSNLLRELKLYIIDDKVVKKMVANRMDGQSKQKSKESLAQMLVPKESCFSTVWLPDSHDEPDLKTQKIPKLNSIHPYCFTTCEPRDSNIRSNPFERPLTSMKKSVLWDADNSMNPFGNISTACYLCGEDFHCREELIRHSRFYHLG
ncbi:hypothetical protein TCAL_15718 [Tigriopus californicus]|uniref:C2H2-type domain-containing protein n=1 Tax=Tigriopus californicus TaxID=6832 RepID=A0A553P6T1_TIGCA|nr:hypothetical protein TCAL_15718 [Tigriopus californicus]